ncbi:MAG: hypothetical protein WBX25_27230 [Rhodomicrobium sp.]
MAKERAKPEKRKRNVRTNGRQQERTADGKLLGGVTGKGWVPGKSGNPSGLAKGMGEVREMAAKWVPQAITTLAEIMLNPKSPPPARVLAANSLIDRYAGKAKQHSEIDVHHEFESWSAQDLRRYLIDGYRKLGIADAIDAEYEVESGTEPERPHNNSHLLPYSSRDD